MQNVLEARGLYYSYSPKKTSSSFAVEDVSIDAAPGSVIGLLGRNGAGKTTLVKLLATILTPFEGSISVAGVNAVKDRRNAQSLIGYSGQDSENSFPHFYTVHENLSYFGQLRGIAKSKIGNQIDWISAALGLEDILKTVFSELSGGQKQLANISRALIHKPRLCFLDEPSKSLDVESRRRLIRYLRHYSEETGSALVITSHNLDEIEELCSIVYVLEAGKIRFRGSITDFVGLSDYGYLIILDNSVSRQLMSEIKGLNEVRDVRIVGSQTQIMLSVQRRPVIDTLTSILRLVPDVAFEVRRPNMEEVYLDEKFRAP